ncbi:VENN motif pre-toxin domain-containing protein [Kosakonia sp. HypNH10]|uniref:VENN motif pre-toxin domain-containing protein n=1 Tax=Kosakonia sp. HypNH10 TaxID=2980101 RepID=UPI002447DFF3|nr:VENN motif pre-toxin domain-containing protein [Kosakonia sp. HypNH10]MDH2912695.1 VENN motif pre-toxin domain-containing protein [Kosakonia sp. HypNH10]
MGLNNFSRRLGIKDTNHLNEDQKQTILALATLASGLAGALTGDSGANAVTAAQAGKTTVKNNYLSQDEAQAFDKEMTACHQSGGGFGSIQNKYTAISVDNRLDLLPIS